MRPTLALLALALAASAPAAAAAPLEIDVLEAYLAASDTAPGTPHCARHDGWVMTPEGPVRAPTGGTNRVLEEHKQWHATMHDASRDFEPSPDDADRFGDLFLGWHAYFVGAYERWRAANGHPPLPSWDPATPMPPELAYPYPERACRDGRDEDPQVGLPSWATLEGGDEPSPLFGYTRLCDFPDLNRFGKAIRDWHVEFHVRVGGDMSAGLGPRDPAFWSGHKHVVDVTETWEASCAAPPEEAVKAAALDPRRDVPAAGAAAAFVAALAVARFRRR